MRAAVLALLLAVSCSQPSQGAASQSPSPTAVTKPSPTPRPAGPTIDALLGRCPTPAELASVDSSLSMKFTSDPTSGTLVCTAASGSRDLTLFQVRTYQAVLMLTWIRFDAPLPWTNLTLDVWFAHAIHGIESRSDAQYSFCCLPGGVIAIQTNNLAVLDKSLPLWESVRWLAALFIHEARHNEGFGHTCATGPRAGQNDNTVAELGAWGVQYYFYVWLAEHTDHGVVPKADQAIARAEAADMLGRFFCQPEPTPSA